MAQWTEQQPSNLRDVGSTPTRGAKILLMPEMVTQTFPYPQALADVVVNVRHMPNYQFELVDHTDDSGASFLALDITHTTLESLRQRWQRSTHHLFIVPSATYNKVNWLRWIFDRIADVDNHERAEFFSIRDDSLLDPREARCIAPSGVDGAECSHTLWQHGDNARVCIGCINITGAEGRHEFVLNPEDYKYTRVFPPLHGNGNDPYFLWHLTTEEEVRKSPGED